MHILFVSSEFHPLAKSGGLADAVASLAKALAKRGHRVTVVLPQYSFVDGYECTALSPPVGVPLGYREEWIGLRFIEHEGVELYMVDHRELLARPGIYGPSPASAYGDNLRRFSLLTRGALQIALALEWSPQVIHSHDWPTALTTVFHRLFYGETRLAGAGTVFSIHNFGYQGWYSLSDAQNTGLTRVQMEEAGLVGNSEVNLVRGALRQADRIVAVSPRYAREIQTAHFGFGLQEEARARGADLRGILNGIDEDEWNPESDTLIPATFSRHDRKGKSVCKRTLQNEFGLPCNEETPLVGMVTRLTEQKGIGALFGPGHGCLYRVCTELPLQFVFLGSGETWCEEEIGRLADRLPGFAALIGYSEALAHRITAGCDFFLMPSTYEPCGLNQMYAMRYGTVPVVTETGGLADTVDGETGFLIRQYSPEGIYLALHEAVQTYLQRKERLERMRDEGMSRDFRWDRSASAYEDLYREITTIRG